MNLEDYYRIVDEQLARSSGGIKGAIRGKCTDCVYDPAAPGSRNQQVHECGSIDCPLYPHRTIIDGVAALPAQLQPALNKSSKQWQRKQQLIRDLQQKGTSRAAVDAFCIDCSFDAHEPGNWRQQITNCDCKDCPLWAVRPVSSKGG